MQLFARAITQQKQYLNKLEKESRTQRTKIKDLLATQKRLIDIGQDAR
jgi:hypothetical protein